MADELNDEPVSSDSDLSVIKAVQEARESADRARQTRLSKSSSNRDLYLGRQDWSHKQEGQSVEFLPKVAISVEQMSALIKKGLTQFGSWFSVSVDNDIQKVITGQQIEVLVSAFLRNLWQRNNMSCDVSVVLGDAVKVGLLESLIILKVHGGMKSVRRFTAEPGDVELSDDNTVKRGEDKLVIQEEEEWRLRIDLISEENYYPDPTGAGLFEIHRVERDLHEVMSSAEDGLYDKEVVARLVDTDYGMPDDEKRTDSDRNQDQQITPSFRKRVVIDEFWGTLLNRDGTIAHENCVCAVANDSYLIRPPEPNPFWHQESPFIAEPLIRVPWSVWHKALYDDAAALNMAMNEIFNLIIDGGLASVWGIKQLRTDDLEDPSQVEGGISQGTTLSVKNTLPHGMKVLETVAEGDVPQDALAVYGLLEKEFTQAALTTELRMGGMPSKEVRATEVIESTQGQSVTLDGLISDLESNIIRRMLTKSWFNILQNADRIPEDVFTGQIDRRTAQTIMRASPAKRFEMFYGMAKFQVHGLSSTMQRAREFQKLVALLQMVAQNPLLLQEFMKKFSPGRTLDHLMRLANVNPEHINKTPEEQEQAAVEASRTAAATQLTGGAQGGGAPAGGASIPAQANQIANPMSGMTANG